jgi:phospholipid transport system substrate-binding protein
MPIMKIPIAFTVIFLLLTMPTRSLSGEQPAVNVIKTLNATLLDCMKRGDELGYSGRYAVLEPVMNRSFFFVYMLMKSSGTYWKELDIKQRKQLLEKYVAWSVATYAARFKKYEGQQFVVVSSEPVLKKYMKVISHIIKKDKKTRELAYLLLENNSAWLIVDIQVEGVSQLSITRSQFKSVLKDKGVGGLLAVLDEKINALELANETAISGE